MKKLFLVLPILALLAIGVLSPTQANADQRYAETITPTLQVGIPGLNNDSFSGSVVRGNSNNKDDCPEGKVCVDTINIYINALYKFGVVAGTIFAIVIIMIGGVEYMIGSSVGGVSKAQKRITGATIGLLLLLSTTAIVTFVNPNAALFKGLQLSVPTKIDPPNISKEGGSIKTQAILSDGSETTLVYPFKNSAKEDDPNMINGGVKGETEWTQEETLLALQKVAAELNDSKFESYGGRNKLKVLKTYEDPKTMAINFYNKCIKNNCTEDEVCNPFPEDSIIEGNYEEGFELTEEFADLTQDMEDEEIFQYLEENAMLNKTPRCAFQTGYAVAVTVDGASTSGIQTYLAKRLEILMQYYGFCRSYSQPWLYELKGHATMVSTQACDWTIGTLLIEPAETCTKENSALGKAAGYTGVKYAASQPKTFCAKPYGSEENATITNTGMGLCPDEDSVNLKTGKCTDIH